MSARNAEACAAFLARHPGATVSAVGDGLGSRDAAATWSVLLEAERLGLIRAEHPEGEPWRFYAAGQP